MVIVAWLGERVCAAFAVEEEGSWRRGVEKEQEGEKSWGGHLVL